MEFKRDILEKLHDSGRDICLYSNITSCLKNYSGNTFSSYSSRLFYMWKNEKRPIPISIVIKIMNDLKKDKILVKSFSAYGGNKISFIDNESLSFYYFLGLILGDGCLSLAKKSFNRYTYSIQIVFRHKYEAVFVKKEVLKLFSIKSSIYTGHGKCYVLHIYSKPLVLILHHKYQIPLGLKYSNLIVPNIVKNARKYQKSAFLKGIFDSDGNIYLHGKNKRKRVQLRQKSDQFINEVKSLLDSIKIHFPNPYYDRANNSWLLLTSKLSVVDKFINEIDKLKINAPVAQPG